jgi:7-cyano-7-deazaguanine synthase
MRRDLVLLSGGLDSSTLLAASHANDRAAVALSVDYGQRHRRELKAAREVAAFYGVEHHVLDMTGWGALLTGSSLTDPDVPVPHGHYADESMKATIVPNRNATLLMAAAGVAISKGCTHVVTAVHAGDHPVYPDCRPEFIQAAGLAAHVGTDGAVKIDAPFVNISKTAIARIAGELGVPIGVTWSCYEGGDIHCGECGTCVERIEAIRDADLVDPTAYRNQQSAAADMIVPANLTSDFLGDHSRCVE